MIKKLVSDLRGCGYDEPNKIGGYNRLILRALIFCWVDICYSGE